MQNEYALYRKRVREILIQLRDSRGMIARIASETGLPDSTVRSMRDSKGPGNEEKVRAVGAWLEKNNYLVIEKPIKRRSTDEELIVGLANTLYALGDLLLSESVPPAKKAGGFHDGITQIFKLRDEYVHILRTLV